MIKWLFAGGRQELDNERYPGLQLRYPDSLFVVVWRWNQENCLVVDHTHTHTTGTKKNER